MSFSLFAHCKYLENRLDAVHRVRLQIFVPKTKVLDNICELDFFTHICISSLKSGLFGCYTISRYVMLRSEAKLLNITANCANNQAVFRCRSTVHAR